MIPVLSRWAPPVFEPAHRESFDRSLWSATAEPGQHHPALAGTLSTQVAVVGAGYTGLAAAIGLATRGIEVRVLDAAEPGFGASGRNGGQVIPLFKYEPDELLKTYGEVLGAGVLDFVGQSAEIVFDLVRRHGIACELSTAGWIQAAAGPQGEALVRRRHAQWKAVGAAVELLDAESMARLMGSRRYPFGWLHRGAGSVQPLSYARGLARAAVGCGATVHGGTRVTAIAREGSRWRLRSERGELLADQVVLATNAYSTGLWPGLRESIIPVYSMQIATDPLEPALAASILPEGQCVADTRHLVLYFRKDMAGRFVIGTRGPFTSRPTERDAAQLLAAARDIYPALRATSFPHVWAGRVAMTADRVPHLHRLAPGVHAALGYNGRGVAMATAMGRLLAGMCLDERDGVSQYPVTDLQSIPFHAFHRLGVHAMIHYYRLMDSLS